MIQKQIFVTFKNNVTENVAESACDTSIFLQKRS